MGNQLEVSRIMNFHSKVMWLIALTRFPRRFKYLYQLCLIKSSVYSEAGSFCSHFSDEVGDCAKCYCGTSKHVQKTELVNFVSHLPPRWSSEWTAERRFDEKTTHAQKHKHTHTHSLTHTTQHALSPDLDNTPFLEFTKFKDHVLGQQGPLADAFASDLMKFAKL